jgi:hypothetical protein
MGKRFNNTETFYNQEVTFTYDNEEMVWFGNYKVRQFGEQSDSDYPGYQDTEIEILETDKIEKWSEEEQDWLWVDERPSILLAVEWEIEKSL